MLREHDIMVKKEHRQHHLSTLTYGAQRKGSGILANFGALFLLHFIYPIKMLNDNL